MSERIIIRNGIVLTLNDADDVHFGGTVVIDADRITTVAGPSETVEVSGGYEIDATGKVVMPGLVDLHYHTALGKGWSDHLPLWEYLQTCWYPMIRALDPESAYWAALASYAESIRCGVSTVNDMYRQLEALAGAAEKIGILAALRQRDQTGRGQWVQTSLLETALAWLSMHIASYLADGEEPSRQGTRSPFFAPYEAYATADGHLVVVGTGGDGGDGGWQAFCRALGLPALADDPRFASNSDRVANAEALREQVETVMRTKPTAHWVQRMRAERVPHAPVQSLAEVLRSEQVAALGAIERIADHGAREIPIVRLPVTMSGAKVTATAPPPALDGHAAKGFG
jgi:hypothetical protein